MNAPIKFEANLKIWNQQVTSVIERLKDKIFKKSHSNGPSYSIGKG